jgi:DeoR/GlpR family transcriptional regulator of sugar metabolism
MRPIEHEAPPGRPLLADARRTAIGKRLRAHGAVTVAEVEREFGVSSMTARRDLAELERQGHAKRTHGGAVMPSIAAHEDSFASRLATAEAAKTALARAAAAEVVGGEAVFLDGSSTAYHVARELLARDVGLTLLTNSLPIMGLVATAAVGAVELVGVGGFLRRLTSSFVGPYAVHTVRAHFADRAIFSVKGVDAAGRLSDADPLEAEVKRAMLDQAEHAALVIDASKLGVRGLSVIGEVADVATVFTDAAGEGELAPLRASGARIEVVASAREGAAP